MKEINRYDIITEETKSWPQYTRTDDAVDEKVIELNNNKHLANRFYWSTFVFLSID